MSISKRTAVGFLVCLTALYLMDNLWFMGGIFVTLPFVGATLFPIGALLTLAGLFNKTDQTK